MECNFAKKVIVLTIATLSWANSPAQEPHRVGIDLGIYDEHYHLGVSYHYMFGRYVGIGGSVGYFSEISSDGVLGNLWRYDDCYYDYDDTDISLYIEPSVVAESPRLNLGRSIGLGLTASAGMRISTNYYCSSSFLSGDQWYYIDYKCRTISANIKAGPTISFGPVALTIGYMFSTLDLDRSYNPTTRQFTRHPIHGAFLEISGRF